MAAAVVAGGGWTGMGREVIWKAGGRLADVVFEPRVAETDTPAKYST